MTTPTHSNEAEFMQCFVTCSTCGDEYSLDPPDFIVREKGCRCPVDKRVEAEALVRHLNPVGELSYAAQYRVDSGGLL